jgi:acyl-coenzyme A thioesterase PaaI-like protein
VRSTFASAPPRVVVSGPGPAGSARAERRAARRRALALLARHVRSLIDASVHTDVEPDVVERVAGEVARLDAELRERLHAGPYSGLLGGVAFDADRPADRLPLSPFAGELNPIAPPLDLRYDGDRLIGSAVLGKAYIGPPGTAHGGVVAGLMDQMVAAAGQRFELGGVTARMTVEFRRPTPLGVPLALAGWLEPQDEAQSRVRKVRAELRAGGEVTVAAEALIVIRPDYASDRRDEPG